LLHLPQRGCIFLIVQSIRIWCDPFGVWLIIIHGFKRLGRRFIIISKCNGKSLEISTLDNRQSIGCKTAFNAFAVG
jgi:hypothetical protein